VDEDGFVVVDGSSGGADSRKDRMLLSPLAESGGGDSGSTSGSGNTSASGSASSSDRDGDDGDDGGGGGASVAASPSISGFVHPPVPSIPPPPGWFDLYFNRCIFFLL
jgi:hypothetical protein